MIAHNFLKVSCHFVEFRVKHISFRVISCQKSQTTQIMSSTYVEEREVMTSIPNETKTANLKLKIFKAVEVVLFATSWQFPIINDQILP